MSMFGIQLDPMSCILKMDVQQDQAHTSCVSRMDMQLSLPRANGMFRMNMQLVVGQVPCPEWISN